MRSSRMMALEGSGGGGVSGKRELQHQQHGSRLNGHPPPVVSSGDRRRHVVIVGGGIAGLVCARTLLDDSSEKNSSNRSNDDLLHVTLIEASSQVGGRIHGIRNHDFCPEGRCVVDVGAEYIYMPRTTSSLSHGGSSSHHQEEATLLTQYIDEFYAKGLLIPPSSSSSSCSSMQGMAIPPSGITSIGTSPVPAVPANNHNVVLARSSPSSRLDHDDNSVVEFIKSDHMATNTDHNSDSNKNSRKHGIRSVIDPRHPTEIRIDNQITDNEYQVSPITATSHNSKNTTARIRSPTGAVFERMKMQRNMNLTIRFDDSIGTIKLNPYDESEHSSSLKEEDEEEDESLGEIQEQQVRGEEDHDGEPMALESSTSQPSPPGQFQPDNPQQGHRITNTSNSQCIQNQDNPHHQRNGETSAPPPPPANSWGDYFDDEFTSLLRIRNDYEETLFEQAKTSSFSPAPANTWVDYFDDEFTSLLRIRNDYEETLFEQAKTSSFSLASVGGDTGKARAGHATASTTVHATTSTTDHHPTRGDQYPMTHQGTPRETTPVVSPPSEQEGAAIPGGINPSLYQPVFQMAHLYDGRPDTQPTDLGHHGMYFVDGQLVLYDDPCTFPLIKALNRLWTQPLPSTVQPHYDDASVSLEQALRSATITANRPRANSPSQTSLSCSSSSPTPEPLPPTAQPPYYLSLPMYNLCVATLGNSVTGCADLTKSSFSLLQRQQPQQPSAQGKSSALTSVNTARNDNSNPISNATCYRLAAPLGMFSVVETLINLLLDDPKYKHRFTLHLDSSVTQIDLPKNSSNKSLEPLAEDEENVSDRHRGISVTVQPTESPHVEVDMNDFKHHDDRATVISKTSSTAPTTRLQADHVVVSVPPPVLPRIFPNLPEEKRDALEYIGFTSTLKATEREFSSPSLIRCKHCVVVVEVVGFQTQKVGSDITCA